VGDDDEGWKGWEAVVANDVTGWIKEITDNGWVELDWFMNIGSGAEHAGGESEEETTKQVGKREGLGTTMQDRYDYLSQENRMEFDKWKGAMLETIDNLINKGIMNMDTTDG